MSYGPYFFYYRCPSCEAGFRYSLELLAPLGDEFGRCPHCGAEGAFVKEGNVSADDAEYPEV